MGVTEVTELYKPCKEEQLKSFNLCNTMLAWQQEETTVVDYKRYKKLKACFRKNG